MSRHPTAHLQARREALLRIPRPHTLKERAEVRTLEAELQARGVLTLSRDF